MAKVQWHALQQRLERDTNLRDRYEETIKKDFDKNYITTADPSCRHSVWYLPHHPVINKQKPDKIRRVTNAASKYKGLSLNDALLTGPDLLCNLHGLLLRFRQYSVAITADIEAMFMQIGIQPKDQDYLRFLWTEDGNEKIFKYNRLIFGATCSPSCAIFVLQKCANDHKQEHPEAYTSIMQQFYMDDFTQTYPSEEEARRSAEEIKTVLHTGGFNLTKFLSNRPAALENLLEEDKAELKAQRILGQTWDPKTDKLMFAKPKFLYTGQQMTQRKVLSMAASLFDPIGLISPFAIRIRCSLQRIIKEGRNWDQPVSECYQQELQEWMDEFDNMTPIEIPRCLIPNTNGTHQLHTFTDASMSAIAAIVYVRTTNADGSSTSRYVISKTKVAPIKQLSIPKLELEAATLGAELAGFCESKMTTTISSKHFWTDSTATLGWIQSKQRQKMYMANRLTKIHENSNQENWRHIPGKMNPADRGTRGLTPSDIPKLWLQPPDFLSKPQDSWNFAEDSDPHICATQATQLQTPVIEVDKFSTWSRLLNSTRMVFQAIRRFRAKVRTRRQNESPETSNTNTFASDENRARNYLIKMSQNELFSGTISALLKGGNLEKGVKLMPFTPFLDEDGLLRVGGRLIKAPLTYNAKHPLLLHSRSKIARLLIEKAHHDCGHQGVEHVKAHLQQTFLMIGSRKVLRSLGKYCFICRRWRADNVRPKMADLPEFRFPDANKQYPFVNTGMDMFGPFYIEDKREGTQMHYVCLFTCLVTRAVLLKVCHDLSTDCLLMTIRRFVSRRGYPDLIVSDNGKNFIGANQAMKLKFQRSYKPDNEYIRLQLAQQNIQWTFNPPLAPHFGGVW